MHTVPTSANGQPALGVFNWREEDGANMPVALQVLTLRGDRITDVTAFVKPSLFPRFGLPQRIGEDE